MPPQWSVTYRFVIAAVAMALVAACKGESLRLGRKGLLAAAFLGFTQFCVNFNAVYLAEQHITSGVVATVFALLLIPATLLGWALARPAADARFVWSSLVAVVGIAAAVHARASASIPPSSRPDRCRHRADACRHARRGDRQRDAGAAGNPPLPAVRFARLVDGARAR